MGELLIEFPFDTETIEGDEPGNGGGGVFDKCVEYCCGDDVNVDWYDDVMFSDFVEEKLLSRRCDRIT
jgi:hypothetical protein